MTPQVSAAIVAGVISVVGACFVVWFTGQLREIRRELDNCLRDRRRLHDVMQLVAAAFVRTLPANERRVLLRKIDESLDADGAADAA